MYILRPHIAHIEAAAANAGIAFLTQYATLLILFVLIQTLLGADGQITIVYVQLNFFLIEARQFNRQFIFVFIFTNIGLHQVACALAKQRIALAKEIVIKEFIHHIFTKNARQHSKPSIHVKAIWKPDRNSGGIVRL